MKEIKLKVFHDTEKSDIDDALNSLYLLPLKCQYSFRLVSDQEEPDYVVFSERIYHSRAIHDELVRYLHKDVILIYCGSESIMPDMNIFDYAVSFDNNAYLGDRYVRWPLIYYFMDRNMTGFVNDINDIDKARKELAKKNKFCNFIYMNSNAHYMRDKLYWNLSTYKPIDSLGHHLNNVPLSQSHMTKRNDENWKEGSISVKKAYKFSIAAENEKFDGYTSEKIITSLLAHTIPIYWGNPYVGEDFNTNAFIDASKFDTTEELIQYIKTVDENDDLWLKLIMEPWQTEEQMHNSSAEVKRYHQFWNNIFDQKKCKAKRRPEGYWTDIYFDWINENYQC